MLGYKQTTKYKTKPQRKDKEKTTLPQCVFSEDCTTEVKQSKPNDSQTNNNNIKITKEQYVYNKTQISRKMLLKKIIQKD